MTFDLCMVPQYKMTLYQIRPGGSLDEYQTEERKKERKKEKK